MGIRNKLGASLNPPSASGTITSNQTGNGRRAANDLGGGVAAPSDAPPRLARKKVVRTCQSLFRLRLWATLPTLGNFTSFIIMVGLTTALRAQGEENTCRRHTCRRGLPAARRLR